MPGKNPAEAVRNYIEPLQQSLSCVTKAVLRATPYKSSEVLTVTFSEPTAEVITAEHEILHLSFIQTFSVEKPPLLRRYKVKTRSYLYMLEDERHREILGFHWHPEGNSEITFPHLHICEGAGNRIRNEIRKIHFRTDRVAFEEFCLMLLDEFAVIPERWDAREILQSNCAKFRAERSWSSV